MQYNCHAFLMIVAVIIAPVATEGVFEDMLVEYVARKGWNHVNVVDDSKLVSGKNLGKALSERFRLSFVDPEWFSVKAQERLNLDENVLFVARRVGDLRPYLKHLVRLKPLAYAFVIIEPAMTEKIPKDLRYVEIEKKGLFIIC